MYCIPALNCTTDIAYWITKDSFFKYFDQEDFKCRKVLNVSQAYLDDWFYSPNDRISFFYLPVFTLTKDGKTHFISGRHRTAVILPDIDELPISFATPMFGVTNLLNYLDKRPLDLKELIELPDFPIVKSLP